MGRALGFLAVQILLVVAGAAASGPKVVTVELLVNPPYTVGVSGDGGQPVGFITDLFKNLKVPGYVWNFQIAPWARMVSETLADKTGSVILPTLTRTVDREPDFLWIAQINSPKYYFIRKGDGPDRLSPESLKRATVAVLQGNTSDLWLRSHGFENLIEVASLEQMVKLVDSGRADYLLKDMTSLDQLLKVFHLASGSFSVAAEVPDLSQPLYIAGSRALDPGLVESLRQQLENLHRTGGFDRLWDLWK